MTHRDSYNELDPATARKMEARSRAEVVNWYLIGCAAMIFFSILLVLCGVHG